MTKKSQAEKRSSNQLATKTSNSPKSKSTPTVVDKKSLKRLNTNTNSSKKRSGVGRFILMSLLKVLIVVTVVILLLAFSPGLLDIEPVYINAPPPPRPFIGSLATNNKLEKMTKLFRNNIAGPESVAFYKDDLYTGLMNGWIVRIANDRTIEPIVTVGDQNCESWEEKRCGRPLGMRFDKHGILYFADSYNGLFKMDVKTGVVTALYHNSEEINGKKSKITNDLDISSSGQDIYFSISSTKFDLTEGIYELMAGDPSGMVVHYNVKTNKTTMLMDELAFANGIQLSPEEDFFLVSETVRRRILKYHLSGNRKGQTDVFIDNLPGAPDNIRSNGKGGYWVGLCVANPPSRLLVIQKLGPYPIVRKVLARSIDVVRVGLKFVDSFYPHPLTKTIIYKFGLMLTYVEMFPNYGLGLELDAQGQIVQSLHAPDGSSGYISEINQHGEHVYIGSPWNEFLGKMAL